ncbi:MAG: MBL fold metallo-hydrolase [Anaerovoracaceae bacterium]
MKVRNIGTGPLMVNTYLAYDEDTKKGFIVDPGGYSKDLELFIAKENIEIEYIILTHGHGDHIGGVFEHLNDHSNAKVVASVDEVPMLVDPNSNMTTQTHGRAISIKPDIEVWDGETMMVGNMELKFIMTPGHSPGGMCILVDKVLFCGDTLFRDSIGRTDFQGGSFKELKESIHSKLFVLDPDTQVLPGHMGPTTIGHEKENNPFV